MINFSIWKDPDAKCIRWGYKRLEFDRNTYEWHWKSGWEGPSLWYGKEFFQSWKLWRKQYI